MFLSNVSITNFTNAFILTSIQVKPTNPVKPVEKLKAEEEKKSVVVQSQASSASKAVDKTPKPVATPLSAKSAAFKPQEAVKGN